MLQEKLGELKEYLMSLELQSVEILQELLEAFDRKYSQLAEQVKLCIMQYVNTLRELESSFNSSLSSLAQKLYDDKYSSEVCRRPTGSHNSSIYLARLSIDGIASGR